MTTTAPRRATPVPRYVYRGDPLAEPPAPELMAIFDRHRGQPDALITVLEEIQEHYGYLPERPLRYTARELRLPCSRVFGVATFYNLFRLHAPGRYQVRVCRGTACHVNHSAAILSRLAAELGVEEDETTADGLFTLQTVACMGACSLAPVLVVNDHIHGRMTPDRAWAILSELGAGRGLPANGAALSANEAAGAAMATGDAAAAARDGAGQGVGS